MAINRFHTGLMIYTAVMVIVAGFLPAVLSATVIYAVGHFIGKKIVARQGKTETEPAYSPTGD